MYYCKCLTDYVIQSFLREQSRGPKKEPYNHFSPGLPSLVGPFLSVAPSIALLNAKIDRRIAKADNDNRMIFFQDVPSDTDRPPLPAGICIMNRKTLDVGEWERAPVLIFFKV